MANELPEQDLIRVQSIYENHSPFNTQNDIERILLILGLTPSTETLKDALQKSGFIEGISFSLASFMEFVKILWKSCSNYKEPDVIETAFSAMGGDIQGIIPASNLKKYIDDFGLNVDIEPYVVTINYNSENSYEEVMGYNQFRNMIGILDTNPPRLNSVEISNTSHIPSVVSINERSILGDRFSSTAQIVQRAQTQSPLIETQGTFLSHNNMASFHRHPSKIPSGSLDSIEKRALQILSNEPNLNARQRYLYLLLRKRHQGFITTKVQPRTLPLHCRYLFQNQMDKPEVQVQNEYEDFDFPDIETPHIPEADFLSARINKMGIDNLSGLDIDEPFTPIPSSPSKSPYSKSFPSPAVSKKAESIAIPNSKSCSPRPPTTSNETIDIPWNPVETWEGYEEEVEAANKINCGAAGHIKHTPNRKLINKTCRFPPINQRNTKKTRVHQKI